MGILPNKPELRINSIQDLLENDEYAPIIDYNDYVFEEDLRSEVMSNPDQNLLLNESTIPIYVDNRRNKKMFVKLMRNMNQFSKMAESDKFQLKKNSGARKINRDETNRIIMAYANPEDICYDCSDLVPDNVSVFSQLLNDKDKMKIWEDFIEKTEKEQQMILEQINESNRPKEFSNLQQHHHNDMPSTAISAQESFNRIENRFKSSLTKKRKVPYEYLKQTENQLRYFFNNNPNGVYLEAINSSYKRLYFHAVVQFLLLQSSSVTEVYPTKMIQVINVENHFNPPKTLLVEFLLKKRKKYNNNTSSSSSSSITDLMNMLVL